MKRQTALNWLVPLVVIAAVIASGLGLFWQGGEGPFSFSTLHGQTVEINGQGLYHHDTHFQAPIFRGTDVVMLFLCAPLLGIAFVLYRRGSLRGGVMLTSVLGLFWYNFASLAFGAAYNEIFLIYLVGFSTSLFAFIQAFTAIDPEALAARLSSRLPRRTIAVFIALAGLSVFVWLIEIVAGLVEGQVPELLASYTTHTTAVLDLGIIAPSAFLTSLLLFRRAPLGYVLAPILLVGNALIGVIVISQTIFQGMAGVELSTKEYIAYVAPFVGMSLFATWLIVRFFRSIQRHS